MSVYSNLYKGAAKKNEAKQKKTQSYVTNLGKQTYKKWKTGGNESSSARKTYITNQNKRIKSINKKQSQVSPRSTFTKVIDALNAPSAALSQARYDAHTGKVSGLADYWNSFKKGWSGAWNGEEYKSNTDSIKNAQETAKAKGEVSLFDRMYATMSGGYTKNGKTYYSNGKEITSDDRRMQFARTMTGMAEDIIVDPTSVMMAPLKAGSMVLKGSGASLKAWELATKTLNASGTLAENAVKAEQLTHRAQTVKKLWGANKANKTNILTATSAERVAGNLKEMRSLEGVSAEEIEKIAQDTVTSFQKNVMHVDTAADELRAKVCGYGNTGFDKARRLLQNQNLKVMEGLQKAGDYTVAPYYNTLTEKLRTTRVAQSLSNSSKTEAMIKSNILGLGQKKSGGTQIEANAFATKQALESGRLQSAMEVNTLEVAEKIRSLVGDMTDEEQVKLLKGIENGDLDTARKLFEEYKTKSGKDVGTLEEYISASEGDFRQIVQLTKDALLNSEKAKFTPMQYMHYSMFNKMPSQATDAEITETMKMLKLQEGYENIDFTTTFLKICDEIGKYADAVKNGTEATRSTSKAAKWYGDEKYKQMFDYMLAQIRVGSRDIGKLAEEMMSRMTAGDAAKLFGDYVVYKTDDIKKLVKKYETNLAPASKTAEAVQEVAEEAPKATEEVTEVAEEAPKVAEETTKGKFTPTLTLEENDVAKYAPEENETYYYNNMQIDAYRRSLNKMKDPSSPQYQKHAKALEEKLKIKQYIEGVAMQNKQAALAKGTEVATKVDDVAEAAVKEAPTPKKVEKVEAPSQPKAEAPKESKGVEVTVKFFGGKPEEALVYRAMNDTKAGGALETAYKALKTSALDARNMGVNPQLYKDAEDLVNLVESTALANGGDTAAALAELSPNLRKNLINSYATTATGYEDLFGRIKGQNPFEKAREYATALGMDQMNNVTTFMTEEQKSFFDDFTAAMELLDDKKGEYRLGKSWQDNLRLVEKLEERVGNAREIGEAYGSEDTVEFVLSELFSDEMQKIIEREQAMRRYGMEATASLEARGGAGRYVPHIESDEYKQTMESTKGTKEGSYTSIYSSIGNPFARPYSATEAIDDMFTTDAGEEIRKLKTNITEIYLDRALHSNTLLYGDDARKFLYENCTNPIRFEELEDLLERFDKMPEGTKIGATYESIRAAIAKKVNEEIEQEAHNAVRAMLEEKFGPDYAAVVDARRQVKGKERSIADDMSYQATRVQALDDIKPGMEARTNLADEATKDVSHAIENRNAWIDDAYQMEYEKGLEIVTDPNFKRRKNAKIHNLWDADAAAAMDKEAFTTSDLMAADKENAGKIFKRMQLDQQYKEWNEQIRNYTLDMRELQKSMSDALCGIKERIMLDYVTPQDEDIKKMINYMNVLRDTEAPYADVEQAMKQISDMLDERDAYLISMDMDYAYMAQLYRDFEDIQKEYRDCQDAIQDLEWLCGYYEGADVSEVVNGLMQSWKKTHYQDLYDAKMEERLGRLFGGDTERIGKFAGNLPLQELTKEQAEILVRGYGNRFKFFDASEQIMSDVNRATRSQQLAHQSAFTKAYDWFMMRYKMANTVSSPGFHSNNIISNQWQMYLSELGTKAMNPENTKLARDILKGQNPNMIVNIGGQQYTYRELHSLMNQTGVVSKTFGQWDLGTDLMAKSNNIMSYAQAKSGEITLPSSLNKIFGGAGERISKYKEATEGAGKLTQWKESAELVEDAFLKPSSNIGQQIEATQRAAFFIGCLKEGQNPTKALETVNKYLFDYSDLTDFEKNVLRRIVPFYTYMRKNVPMHIETLLTNPRRMSGFASVMETADSDDDTMLPNNRRNIWTQQYMQIPTTNIGIDWKLPIEAAFQRPFDWTVKDMESKNYGQVTPESAINTVTSLINNPITNSIYTAISGSSPAIYNTQDIDTSTAGRAYKVAKGLAGTAGSSFMELGEYMSALESAKKEVAKAVTENEKETANKHLKKAQKNLNKTISKFFAAPVDTDMFDYQEWKGHEADYIDYDTGEVLDTYPSYLSQKEIDKNYQENWGKMTLEDNEKKAAYQNEVYRQQAEDFKGRYLKGQSKQQYLETTFHVKDQWQFQKEAGITKLSYAKWLNKYYNI